MCSWWRGRSVRVSELKGLGEYLVPLLHNVKENPSDEEAKPILRSCTSTAVPLGYRVVTKHEKIVALRESMLCSWLEF